MRDESEDPRQAFLRGLPRKTVEIKATLGALIADPRSTRMRDELKRRAVGVHALARSYGLPSFCEGLKAIIDLVDATRSQPALQRPQLDRLAALVASLSSRAELDTRDSAKPAAMSLPQGTRSDIPHHTLTLFPPALGPTGEKFGPPPPGATLPLGLDAVSTPESPAAEAPRGPGSPRTITADLAPFAPIGAARGAVAAPSPTGPLQVLLCGSTARASSLLEACGTDVEVQVTRVYDDAVVRARETAPDVIVAELDPPADGVALLDALKSDPVTEFLPVILLASAGDDTESVRFRLTEAFDVLPDAADGETLRKAIVRAVKGGVASVPPPTESDLGDLTLDELVTALTDELKRGIVGAAAPRARTARIALGHGSEVLAATWEAIARIREVIERSSEGAVKFQLPAAPRGLPGTDVFSLSEDPGAFESQRGDDPLPGRLALVVDDDRAVVSQFESLLRDAGMRVVGCYDGESALARARETQPDVVVSDILMPGLDGFGLCRAFRRDVVLRHTPVILISWKDDLLQRMRELGASAQGYLRKEASGEAILARIRATLRLRVRLLRRVADLTAGEVRGRVEHVGAVALLTTVAVSLGDATVAISDSVSVTELDLRGGAVVNAVRTGADGNLTRGATALMQVLGASAARFTVSRARHAVRATIQEPLSALLRRSADALVTLESSVSGAALLEVVRVELDTEAALAYARSLPAPMRRLVERVATGDAPREMILRDGVSPAEIEPVLVELARRGAITRVVGPSGARVETAPMAAVGPELAPDPPRAGWKTLDFNIAPVSGPLPEVETRFAAVHNPSSMPPAPEAPVGVMPALPPPPRAPTVSRETLAPAAPAPEPVSSPVEVKVDEAAASAGVDSLASLADVVMWGMQATAPNAEESWSEVVLDAGLVATRPNESPRRSPPPVALLATPDVPLPDLGDLVTRSVTPPGGAHIPLTSIPAAPKVPAGMRVDADATARVSALALTPLVEATRPSEPAPVSLLTKKAPEALATAFKVAPAPLSESPAREVEAPEPDAGARVTVEIAPETAAALVRASRPELAPAGTESMPPVAEPLVREADEDGGRWVMAALGDGAEADEVAPQRDDVAPQRDDVALQQMAARVVPGAPEAPRGVPGASELSYTDPPPAPSRPPPPPAPRPQAIDEVSEQSLAAALFAAPRAEPEAPATPEPPAPAAAEPASSPSASSIEAPRRAPASMRPTAFQSPPPPSPWGRSVALLLGVVVAFALSYFAVNAWVSRAPRAAVEADAAADVAAQRDPVAVQQTPGLDAGAEADDEAAAAAATPAGSDGGAEGLDPGPWLDGGSLGANEGLLVLETRAAGVRLDVDNRPVGAAPAVLRLSEGLHTVRYQAGVVTGFEFATVRLGRAVVVHLAIAP